MPPDPVFDKALVRMLEQRARELRVNILRMIHAAQSGHPGGALSAADIVTALYFHFMNIDPKRPRWPERDRFVLSKGHACPVLYATFCMLGYVEESALLRLREFGSPFQGHPSMKDCPGIDITTGSLGNGLGAAVGMALAGRMDGRSYRVFAMLGDGELDEGVVWEAAMCAAKYRLSNLVAFVDYNHLQLDGTTEEIMPLEPLVQKWQDFGWRVFEMDAHDMEQILATVTLALAEKQGPSMIIAHSVKGKGVDYMEGQLDWHGKAPSDDQLARALAQLEAEEVHG